jgi:hypothetical protein
VTLGRKVSRWTKRSTQPIDQAEYGRQLAFAAVHQLLAPMFENLELLPARQRDEVALAFGLIITLRQTPSPRDSPVCLTRQLDILAGSRQIVE